MSEKLKHECEGSKGAGQEWREVYMYIAWEEHMNGWFLTVNVDGLDRVSHRIVSCPFCGEKLEASK